jgi:hypothetical protein
MADYQLATPDADGPVLRTADGASIPADPANRDWVEYQNWLALGNTPDPYVPPPEPVPAPPTPEVTDLMAYDHESRIRVLEGLPPLSSIDEFLRKWKG